MVGYTGIERGTCKRVLSREKNSKSREGGRTGIVPATKRIASLGTENETVNAKCTYSNSSDVIMKRRWKNSRAY